MSRLEEVQQIKMLQNVMQQLKRSMAEIVSLEPLLPGSLTNRQARMRLSTSEALEQTKVNYESLLLPEPHAWYISRQAVPDYFLNRVQIKNLPYILVFCDSINAADCRTIQSILHNTTTSRSNIFLLTTENTHQPTIKQFFFELQSNIEHVSECHHLEHANFSDKLSLIKHAYHVISGSIGEIGDAVLLGVPCSSYKLHTDECPFGGNYGGTTDQYTVDQSNMRSFFTNQLKNHTLIKTYQDLAIAVHSNVTEATDKDAKSLSNPIMPLTFPSLTRTRKQSRDEMITKNIRKAQKFRESPKRFFSDSKLFRSLKINSN